MIKNLATASTTLNFIKNFAGSANKVQKTSAIDPVNVTEFASVAQAVPYVAPGSKLCPLTQKDEEIMAGSGKPGVWFLLHNDPTSWMLFVPVMCEYGLKMVEKYNSPFYPVIFFHKLLNQIPVANQISKAFAGNSAATYKDVVDLMKSGKPYHFGTCPEGSNCMYDYGGPVADFQQFALVKAAIEGGANISVVTFKQKLNLAVSVKVPFIGQFKKNAKGVKIPFFWLMQNPINAVYEVLDPGITPEEFALLTKEQQKEVVQEVAKRIKQTFEYRYSQIEEPK